MFTFSYEVENKKPQVFLVNIMLFALSGEIQDFFLIASLEKRAPFVFNVHYKCSYLKALETIRAQPKMRFLCITMVIAVALVRECTFSS